MGLLDWIGGGKNKKFIEAHRVSPKLEPLLTTGAILTYANQHPTQVLATLPDTVQNPRDILSTMGIHEEDNVEGSIMWLMESGDRAELDGRFKAFKGGDAEALSHVQKKMYRNMLEYMDGNPLYAMGKRKTMTRAFAETVNNLDAWDLERAAFWARMSFNAGFISEENAWEVLQACHTAVKEQFSDWAEYLVSFMNGRILVMCNPDHETSMQEIFDNGCLLGDPKWGAIWAMHPL